MLRDRLEPRERPVAGGSLVYAGTYNGVDGVPGPLSGDTKQMLVIWVGVVQQKIMRGQERHERDQQCRIETTRTFKDLGPPSLLSVVSIAKPSCGSTSRLPTHQVCGTRSSGSSLVGQ